MTVDAVETNYNILNTTFCHEAPGITTEDT